MTVFNGFGEQRKTFGVDRDLKRCVRFEVSVVNRFRFFDLFGRRRLSFVLVHTYPKLNRNKTQCSARNE